MEHILYELRPFIFFIAGFLTAQLDSPLKWVSVVLLFLASLLILERRYYNRVIRKRGRTY